MRTLTITSNSFENNRKIPSNYTCDGSNINPHLKIEGVPENAQSVVIIMDDPDIPDFVKQKMGIEVYDHWVVFNISPDVKEIKEGVEPEGTFGINSAGENKYTGPCPPDREHRYFFKVYALDSKLNLPEGSTKKEVEEAMKSHVLASGELMGRYERTKS